MTDEPRSTVPSTARWDVLAGLATILIGAAFLYLASSLRPGTLNRMGPGYVPQSVSWLLIGLGTLISIKGLIRQTDDIHWPLLRPLLVVIACPLLFALLIGKAGLVITVFVVASIARLAQPQPFDVEAIAMPALLTGFCVVLFSYLLKLSIPLWPAS